MCKERKGRQSTSNKSNYLCKKSNSRNMSAKTAWEILFNFILICWRQSLRTTAHTHKHRYILIRLFLFVLFLFPFPLPGSPPSPLCKWSYPVKNLFYLLKWHCMFQQGQPCDPSTYSSCYGQMLECTCKKCSEYGCSYFCC